MDSRRCSDALRQSYSISFVFTSIVLSDFVFIKPKNVSYSSCVDSSVLPLCKLMWIVNTSNYVKRILFCGWVLFLSLCITSFDCSIRKCEIGTRNVMCVDESSVQRKVR